ncbi:MAG TPA: DUF58 domain-containing protein [Gemmatimonadaceae bacterium]|nr:DUF58 domain-containing protein [Gemmatimonadaceae bacterium]
MAVAEVFSYGEILDEVRSLRWPARSAVSAVLPGRHLSRRHGTSAEFTEYRPYRQGDPPQKIDWKVFARTDRAYIRLSHDHAVLPTAIVVDASASMAFPAGTHDKYARACRIATGLASIAYNSGDPVGVVVATASGMVSFPPRSRAGVIAEIARTLASTRPAGAASVAAALGLAARFARRIILVSDMLGDLDETLTVARAERARAVELYAVHVVGADEIDPPRSALVEDPEEPSVRRTLSDSSRAEYARRFGAWRTAVASSWLAVGVSYHESITGRPLLTDLRRIVARPR